jgi:hypothetical protein
MNTKKVLYNALASQLEAKKADCERYNNEIHTPAFETLRESVKEWFISKINTKFEKFEFTGDQITLNTSGDNWRGDVNIRIRGWSSENRYTELDWNGDTINSKETLSLLDKAILIGEMATNFHLIENKFRINWYPQYLKITDEKNEYNKSYDELKTALKSLENEIRQDTIESMKQIGFEIKSFKPYVYTDYDYIDNERKFYIKERLKDIPVQISRSKYDKVYASGFKILSKKGNKYKVEIYRENNMRTYDILEKKFDDFVDKVAHWESYEADEKKNNANERLSKENN